MMIENQRSERILRTLKVTSTGDVFVVGHGNTGTGVDWIFGRADSDGGLGFAQTFSTGV